MKETAAFSLSRTPDCIFFCTSCIFFPSLKQQVLVIAPFINKRSNSTILQLQKFTILFLAFEELMRLSLVYLDFRSFVSDRIT